MKIPNFFFIETFFLGFFFQTKTLLLPDTMKWKRNFPNFTNNKHQIVKKLQLLLSGLIYLCPKVTSTSSIKFSSVHLSSCFVCAFPIILNSVIFEWILKVLFSDCLIQFQMIWWLSNRYLHFNLIYIFTSLHYRSERHLPLPSFVQFHSEKSWWTNNKHRRYYTGTVAIIIFLLPILVRTHWGKPCSGFFCHYMSVKDS